MDDKTLLARLKTWRSMPDHVIDVRDFQPVKTRPYPAEVKTQFFRHLYEELNEEQRRKLPYIMGDCPGWVFCKLFLEADPVERERLFERITKTNGLSFGAILGYAESIKSKHDINQLREGLAAAVLSDGHEDYRDILTSLCKLWLATAWAGIDPLPYFQAAAQTATDDDPYGIGSTREMLANFHKYAIFQEQVAPYLPTL